MPALLLVGRQRPWPGTAAPHATGGWTHCLRPLTLGGVQADGPPELVEDTSLPSAPLSETP